jgi:hypothetical protein
MKTHPQGIVGQILIKSSSGNGYLKKYYDRSFVLGKSGELIVFDIMVPELKS